MNRDKWIKSYSDLMKQFYSDEIIRNDRASEAYEKHGQNVLPSEAFFRDTQSWEY